MTGSKKSDLSLDLLKLDAAKANYQRYLSGGPRLSKLRRRPRTPEKIELMGEMGRIKQKLYPPKTIVCDGIEYLYFPFFDPKFKPTPRFWLNLQHQYDLALSQEKGVGIE